MSAKNDPKCVGFPNYDQTCTQYIYLSWVYGWKCRLEGISAHACYAMLVPWQWHEHVIKSAYAAHL